jgi:hypothetical protein
MVRSGAVPVRKHLMHFWGVTAKPLVHPNRIAVVSKPFETKAEARRFLKHLEAENKQSKIGVIWGEPKVVKLDGKDSDGDGTPDIVDCKPLDTTKQDRERYSYDWVGYGLILKDTETGKDVLIQGEDGSRLYDELEKLWNKKKWKSGASKEQINDSIISEYFEVR